MMSATQQPQVRQVHCVLLFPLPQSAIFANNCHFSILDKRRQLFEQTDSLLFFHRWSVILYLWPGEGS